MPSIVPMSGRRDGTRPRASPASVANRRVVSSTATDASTLSRIRRREGGLDLLVARPSSAARPESKQPLLLLHRRDGLLGKAGDDLLSGAAALQLGKHGGQMPLERRADQRRQANARAVGGGLRQPERMALHRETHLRCRRHKLQTSMVRAESHPYDAAFAQAGAVVIPSTLYSGRGCHRVLPDGAIDIVFRRFAPSPEAAALGGRLGQVSYPPF